MNTIEAIIGESEFVPERHLTFVIDGRPLDQILAEANPGLNGLIPTTLDWLENEDEQDEVWQRFTQHAAQRLVIPVLCCPDDLDFSCSLVVVDAQFESDVVQWVKFGLDTTPSHRLPHAIGSCAEWLSGVGPFTFARDNYEDMVQAFVRLRSTTNRAR